MRPALFMAVPALLVGLCGPAATQDFTASDVVTFLLEQVDPGEQDELCVQSEAECAERAQEATFDASVTFEFDSATLTPQARENLEEVAQALLDERLANAAVVIEGHTDGRGAENYNQFLSEWRAEAVAAYLRDAGVEPERITVFGLGEAAPRLSDPMDAGNRRVELRLDFG